MSPFLILMFIGLAGLFIMAVPAFGRHAHTGAGASHITGGSGHAVTPGAAHVGHAGQTGAMHGQLSAAASKLAAGAKQGVKTAKSEAGNANVPGAARFLPSPRAIFSVLALYGAFGNLLNQYFHLGIPIAAVLAAIPALLIERFMVTPLWNMLFSFQSKPCSPLEDLILADAEAVTPFRNGKGIVSVVRDGRMVQLTAHLPADQSTMQVKVGDVLQVEDVDSAGERLTVSVK